MGTAHHNDKKAGGAKQLERQQHVRKQIETYRKPLDFLESKLSGTGLSGNAADEETLQHIETMTVFLQSDIPLAKVDCIWPLLERRNHRLTDSTAT